MAEGPPKADGTVCARCSHDHFALLMSKATERLMPFGVCF
jgi:hypothetical protein